MSKNLRVGIVGASAQGGWAAVSHVPALQALQGLELHAVGARSQAAADAAAKAFGVPHAFGDVNAMIRDPQIDLVVIAVRVPSHHALVLEALRHGKHVFCEWPLGRDVAESEALKTAAAAGGVHAAIGLQARMNPALRRAQALIAGGAIGRPLSARLYSGTVAFGPTTTEANLYLEDAANGATHLTIHGGHALDAAIALLGPLADLSARASTQFPEVRVGDAGAMHRRTLPDHVMSVSMLASGGQLAVEVVGGRPADARFRLEVDGEAGSLALEGGAARGFQSGRLRLSLNGRAQSIEDAESGNLIDTAANVAGVYAALRDDILAGTRTAPDFAHAVRLSRLIDDLGRAASGGVRLAANGWPEA
jgi:predicted dehydrogenase